MSRETFVSLMLWAARAVRSTWAHHWIPSFISAALGVKAICPHPAGSVGVLGLAALRRE